MVMSKPDSRRRDKDAPKKEFDEVLLEVRRVTKVTTWGRRMTFRATILVGNKKGKIGIGVAKWTDVAIAVRKASHEAYKNISIVPITKDGSIPYPVTVKYKAAIVKLLPAASGTWLKAWSSVRLVLDLVWYTNILSKIVGTNNKLNNALTTIRALTTFKADWAKPEKTTPSDKNKEVTQETEKKDMNKKTPKKVVKDTKKTEKAENIEKKEVKEKKAPVKKTTEAKKPVKKKTAAKTTTKKTSSDK